MIAILNASLLAEVRSPARAANDRRKIGSGKTADHGGRMKSQRK
jgi:hypothetical protein